MGFDPRDPLFDSLREMRRREDVLVEELEDLRAKISRETRGLYNGRDGKPMSLREIAAAAGVRHGTVDGWLKRGAG